PRDGQGPDGADGQRSDHGSEGRDRYANGVQAVDDAGGDPGEVDGHGGAGPDRVLTSEGAGAVTRGDEAVDGSSTPKGSAGQLSDTSPIIPASFELGAVGPVKHRRWFFCSTSMGLRTHPRASPPAGRDQFICN